MLKHLLSTTTSLSSDSLLPPRLHLLQSGEGGAPQSDDLAAKYFERAAELGDPAAQEEMGFIHASGLGRPLDAAQALVYWYFAAAANRTGAQLALGYRHAYGLAVPQSCAAAVLYYTPAALAALAPPPGSQQLVGQPPQMERLRLSADYAAQRAARTRERDMVGYYRYSADHGNADAAAAMGQLLVSGGRGVSRDYSTAAEYLRVAASKGDADALAALGMLFANGQGVERDDVTAVRLLRAAADKGHLVGQYGLGLSFLGGFGVLQDSRQALSWLVAAAEQGSADAHAALGALHAQGLAGLPRDRSKALLHLNTAAHGGHLLASFAVAMLQLSPPGVAGASPGIALSPVAASQAAGLVSPLVCRSSAAFLKQVAERGEVVRQVVEQAGAAFGAGDEAKALQLYLKGAHMGVELAQANAAFLLQRRSRLQGEDEEEEDFEQRRGQDEGMALGWLSRSAEQGWVPSLVAVGDAHFYGKGTPVDLRLAAQAYMQAGGAHNAQALFNLGAMHHWGIGLPRDAHLAKRYYDLSRAAAVDARVPTALALWALRWQTRWEEAEGWGGALTAPLAHLLAAGRSAVLTLASSDLVFALLTGALALLLRAIRMRRAAAAQGGEPAAEGTPHTDDTAQLRGETVAQAGQ